MAGAAVDADRADDVQDQVLGADAGRQFAFDIDRQGLGLALQQTLGGQHVADLAGADAEGQRAERAVGGGVAVAADDGLAGLGQAQFRADHVDDAAMVAVVIEQLDAVARAVAAQGVDLVFGFGGVVGQAAVGVGGQGRGGVVERALGQIRAARREPARFQFGEGLR